MKSSILKEVALTLADGGFSPARERIAKETALEINVDGRHYTTAMMLATLEKEFVIGHLFSQGIIHRAADIASLTVKNNTANVMLSANASGGRRPSTVKSNLKVPREYVFDCVRAILQSEVFTETEAVHSAGLFLDGKEAIAIAEDLGRHNALDKVIGRGLLQGTNFSLTLAASTGRQPSEMVYKCLNAGIPIIATKGVPTTLAVEIAVKAGITIAGLVRGSTMTIYSHPERII
jgi:FdhD protein